MSQPVEFESNGLPPFERFYLNLFLKVGTAFRSDEAILSDFRTSATDILRVVDENDLGSLSQIIRIPRLQGIEDSSRQWSVLMVLDHLNQVNKAIMDTVRSLKSNSHPLSKIQIADFKPSTDTGEEAIDQFRDGCQRYWSFAKSHQPLRTTLTFNHPWFGNLDGHAWHSLAAAHQRIHRRQIYKIMALQGVA